jgi:S-adenosylmethionine synthetase
MADINITLKSNIPQLISLLDDMIKQEQEHQVAGLLTEAQAQCPVVTGKLRSSGYKKTSSTNTEITSEVGFTAEYANKVEADKHFLRKSYLLKEQPIVDGIKNKIRELIGRVSNV